MLDILLFSSIQGFTEFLPISSSAHIYILDEVLKIKNVSFQTILSAHFGTLLAAIIYFHKEIIVIIKNYKNKNQSEIGFFIDDLVIATIPVVFVGFFLYNFFENFNSIYVIGYALIVSAIIFILFVLIANKGVVISKNRYVRDIGVGLMQCFSIIPGVSRSGSTMTSAKLFAMSNKNASIFSMLLAIPVISGAFLLSFIDLYQRGVDINYFSTFFVILVSFIIAIATIHLFLKLVDKIGFIPFLIYQIIIGLSILLYIN